MELDYIMLPVTVKCHRRAIDKLLHHCSFNSHFIMASYVLSTGSAFEKVGACSMYYLYFLQHRPEDTLYLEVTAPIVRPGLAVVSHSGRTNTDFSNVGTGC